MTEGFKWPDKKVHVGFESTGSKELDAEDAAEGRATGTASVPWSPGDRVRVVNMHSLKLYLNGKVGTVTEVDSARADGVQRVRVQLDSFELDGYVLRENSWFDPCCLELYRS